MRLRGPARPGVLVILLALLGLALAAGLVLGSGLLARPSQASLARLAEIPEYDLLEVQAGLEREILAAYASAPHGLENPFVALNPYGMNPLAALLIFDTPRPARIELRVLGDDGPSTLGKAFEGYRLHHELPVLGLYPGRTNRVRLDAIYATGEEYSTVLSIATDPLPADFQVYSLVASRPAQMEPGLTLCVACFEDSWTCLVDSRGEVRGYLSNNRMAHGTAVIRLRNGHMLATGDEYRQVPYNMASLYEFDWLGKVFREYEIPNGVHHDLRELPNGDFLCASNATDLFASGTREDVAIIVDRSTGAVRRSFDFRTILDEARDPYTHFHPDIKNQGNVDWMHMNGAQWDSRDGGLVVSSPIQSMVVKLDPATQGIRWILGPPEGYGPGSAQLARFLLRPVGEGFEWSWAQHDPELLPDQDGNPDTLDLLLLDNGQSRSFTRAGAIPAEANWSRGVQYRIDEKAMTVRQVWQYGKERGSECYAAFLGGISWLPRTGNRLIAFGGQLRREGRPTDEIFSAVLGASAMESRIVEVNGKGEPVFELAVKGNDYSVSAETYRASRIDPYPSQGIPGSLAGDKGLRLGSPLVRQPLKSYRPPLLPSRALSLGFNDIHREGRRLVIDGQMAFRGKPWLLGRAWLVFRGEGRMIAFAADSGLNGRFFASLDLSSIPAGVYRLSVVGAVREGNDTLHGRLHIGQVHTGYKLSLGSRDMPDIQ